MYHHYIQHDDTVTEFKHHFVLKINTLNNMFHCSEGISKLIKDSFNHVDEKNIHFGARWKRFLICLLIKKKMVVRNNMSSICTTWTKLQKLYYHLHLSILMLLDIILYLMQNNVYIFVPYNTSKEVCHFGYLYRKLSQKPKTQRKQLF